MKIFHIDNIHIIMKIFNIDSYQLIHIINWLRYYIIILLDDLIFAWVQFASQFQFSLFFMCNKNAITVDDIP